jgi:hypothetical protein
MDRSFGKRRIGIGQDEGTCFYVMGLNVMGDVNQGAFGIDT